MNRLFLLGYPLGHSVSAQMQNAALTALGLADWRYEPRPLSPEALNEFLADRRKVEWMGANVTIPYKQAVIPWLDDLSEVAREIGAVNTLRLRGGRLYGDNTDVYGFVQALHRFSVPVQGARILLFGAGGAARGAAWALAREGVRSIAVVDRTQARARVLVEMLQVRFPGLAAVAQRDALPDADTLINATSLGMAPHQDASPLPAGARIRPGTWVMDLVYNPIETRLLKQARAMGAHTLGGLEMLIQQGARSLEDWTGRPAPLEVMRRAAYAALKASIPSREEG